MAIRISSGATRDQTCPHDQQQRTAIGTLAFVKYGANVKRASGPSSPILDT
jgi:hypothetical protein